MSKKRKSSVNDVIISRLLSGEKLSPEDQQTLLEHLESSDIYGAVDVVYAQRDLGHPARVVSALAERIPATLPVHDAMQFAPVLSERLGDDAYADLVCCVVPRLPAPGQDEPAGSARWFLEFLRGTERFNRIHRADLDAPRVEGAGGRLGLELAIDGLRHYPDGLLKACVERSKRSGPDALRIWRIAIWSGDVELERAVRPHALARFDLSVEPSTMPLWQEQLFQQALAWAGSEPDDTRERSDALFALLEDAHSRGQSWSALRDRLMPACPRIDRRLRERCFDEDPLPPFDASVVLRDRLTTGEASGWSRFFQWIEGREFGPTLQLRDLLRVGRIPDGADDEFWKRYLDAWERARAAERERIARLERLAGEQLLPGLPTELRQAQMGRLDRELLPLLSAKELGDNVLAAQPTVTSAAALMRAIKDEPELLGDERVASFAPFITGLSHDGLPTLDTVRWTNDAALRNFLALHGPCGAVHFRDHVRSELEARPNSLEGHLAWTWLETIVDDELRSDLKARLLSMPWPRLVKVAERHPSWVSREEVLARAPDRVGDLGRLDDLPAWLDELILARARSAKEEHLAAVVRRFQDKERPRAALFELLRARLPESAPGDGVAGALGDVLVSRSSWENHGAEIVHALLTLGRAGELSALVYCADHSRWAARFSDKPRMIAMHLALARGTLMWALERLRANDHESVERALIAIAFLDPPPTFTRDLRRVSEEKIKPNEVCRHWLTRLHVVTENKGGRDAEIRGLRECIAELSGLGGPNDEDSEPSDHEVRP